MAGKLASMDRYSQTRLINPESVLEHTGYVCMCSLIIARRILKNGRSVNIALLMSKAAVHDIEESITGDIACPTKYWDASATSTMKRISDEASVMAFRSIGDDDLYEIWADSKEGFEGQIVSLADKLAVVYKVHQEYALFGNKTIIGHVSGLIGSLKKMKLECRKELHEFIDEAILICKELIE